MESNTRDGLAGRSRNSYATGTAGGVDTDIAAPSKFFGKTESELAMWVGTGLIWLGALVAAAIFLPNFLVKVPISPTSVETVMNWGALWSAGLYGILLGGIGWVVRSCGRILVRLGI